MEMIERYLQAVKFALPEGEREDITRELRDSICSQVEEKESSLGRPINQDEVAELLKKMGNPLQLASRYGKMRQLISATLFPIYWKVLQLALGIALLVHAGVSIAMAAAGKPFLESLGVLFGYPGAALMVFAWVTLVFAAMEYFGARLNLGGSSIAALQIGDDWDPFTLPSLTKQAPQKSRFELIVQLVVQTFFGVWWLAGLRYQYLILGPGYVFLRFSPVWQTIYPLFVGMVVVDLILIAARIARPQWTSGRQMSRLVMGVLGLIVLYFLVSVPELFVAADPSSLEFQTLAKTTNFGLHMGLVVAVIVNVVMMGRDAVMFVWRRLNHANGAVVGL